MGIVRGLGPRIAFLTFVSVKKNPDLIESVVNDLRANEQTELLRSLQKN